MLNELPALLSYEVDDDTIDKRRVKIAMHRIGIVADDGMVSGRDYDMLTQYFMERKPVNSFHAYEIVFDMSDSTVQRLLNVSVMWVVGLRHGHTVMNRRQYSILLAAQERETEV